MKLAEQLRQLPAQQKLHNDNERRKELLFIRLAETFGKGHRTVTLNVSSKVGWETSNRDILSEPQYWVTPGRCFKEMVCTWLREDGFIISFMLDEHNEQYVVITLWDK